MNARLQVAPEVTEAIASGAPVVALETTLVTHGLPPPDGVRVAAQLEEDVRAAGAVPATIGVLGGVVRVGLTASDVERLAATPDVPKLNLSNLAACLADGGAGSTTVAATVWAAHAAGIRVMATGGIGGVHREFVDTGDVSADLTALGRFAVAVVCAGAKAVLDLPRTLEALETLGVPVLGFGTDHFPAFYRRDSGRPVDARFDDAAGLARAVTAHFEMNTGSGVVIGNPVPEADEMPVGLYDSALAGALADAAAEGVRGRAVTPFLLDRLRQRTGARSVTTNVALLRSNARLAGALAVTLTRTRMSR